MEFIKGIWNVLTFILINVYHTVWFLTKLLFLPFVKLYRWLREKLSCTSVGISLDVLNDRFHHFNGFIPFCLFIVGAVYSIILLLLQIGVEDGFTDYAQTLVFHTPVGSFLGFLEEGLNFTPATAVSIAFSGAVFSAVMGNEKPEGFLGYLFHFLRHLVFFVASAHLAVLLSGVFQSVGDWGFDTIKTLFNKETNTFFSTLGKFLLILLIGYPALELLLLAVKEYTECIVLGVLYLIFVLLVSVVMQYILKFPNSDVLEWIMVIVLFAVDLFRPFIDKLFDVYLSERSLYPAGWIEEFGED